MHPGADVQWISLISIVGGGDGMSTCADARRMQGDIDRGRGERLNRRCDRALDID
jgi:hypothetical protein